MKKIAAQDSKINSLTEQQQSAQAQVQRDSRPSICYSKATRRSLKQKMKNCLLNLQDFLLRLMNCLKTS